METPQLDEYYLSNQQLSIKSLQNNTTFKFQELQDYSKDGLPILTEMVFHKNSADILPYSLSFKDSYELCCNKLSKKADYISFIDEKIKIWVINIHNIEFSLSIEYTNKELQNIESISIYKLDLQTEIDLIKNIH
jgi:hypothetical protein